MPLPGPSSEFGLQTPVPLSPPPKLVPGGHLGAAGAGAGAVAGGVHDGS